MSVVAAKRRARNKGRGGAFVSSLFGGGTPEATAQFRQAGLFLAMTLLAALLSFAHLGVVARPLFMLGALVGAHHYRKRSPWLLVTWTFWLWTVSPMVRRLVEYPGHFNDHDVLLLVPNMALLWMVPDIIRARGLMRRGTFVASLGIVLPILYGLLNSLYRGEVEPAAVATADWLAPLFYYLFVVVHAKQLGTIGHHLRAFFAVNLTAITLYGLYQFKFMTPWDFYWLANSGLVSIDKITDPTQNRVFGTFNNEGFLAAWVAWSVILLSRYWSRIQLVIVPLALFLLLTTLVRSQLLTLGLAYALLVLISPPRNLFKQAATVGFGAVLLFGVMSVVNPNVASTISDRLGSMNHLNNDTSANVRREIWAQTPGMIADEPLGGGIASVGRAASMPGVTDGHSVVDSGVLGAYLAFGWVFGSLYLFSMLVMPAVALVNARRARSRDAAAAAAAAVVLAGLLPFVTVNGFDALMLWFALGLAGEFNLQAAQRRVRSVRDRPAALARRQIHA